MSNELKRRIKSLEARRGSGRDGQIRQQQVNICPPCSDIEPLLITAYFAIFILDRPGEEEIRGCYSELSRYGVSIPHQVQAAVGEAVQDWYVLTPLLDEGHHVLIYHLIQSSRMPLRKRFKQSLRKIRVARYSRKPYVFCAPFEIRIRMWTNQNGATAYDL